MARWIAATGQRLRRRLVRGQGLVEFTLILPLLLLVFFVIIELGRLFFAWMAVENGARFGVRYAITGRYNPAHCLAGCATVQDQEAARLTSIDDEVHTGFIGIQVDPGATDSTQPGYSNVVVCPKPSFSQPASLDENHTCAGGERGGEPGEDVIVAVEFNHRLITPILSGIWPELRLDAQRESKVETFRMPMASGGSPGEALPLPPIPPTPKPPGPALPEPSCDPWDDGKGNTVKAFEVEGGWANVNDPVVRGYFRNNTPHDVSLVGARLDWVSVKSTHRLNALAWEFQMNFSNPHNTFWNGPTSTSPTIAREGQTGWNSAANVTVPKNTWYPERENVWYRDGYRLEFNKPGLTGKALIFAMTFRFSNGLECTVSKSWSVYNPGGGGGGTPPPTPTPGGGGGGPTETPPPD